MERPRKEKGSETCSLRLLVTRMPRKKEKPKRKERGKREIC
jgi:hypothetical protein